MKDQVLNIEQIQELIDLGFDVTKYSSAFYELCNNPNGCSYKTENRLFLSDNTNGTCECGYQEEIETLTIGDIINILPDAVLIEEEDNRIFRYALLETDMKTFLRYAGFGRIIIEIERKDNFIDMLFDLLKWCIINKHI